MSSPPAATSRRLWADHNVRTHGTGTKRFHHPVVGELTLAYEKFAITAEPGLVLLVVPGGLFEVVFLPIWLIARGFSVLPAEASATSPNPVTAS